MVFEEKNWLIYLFFIVYGNVFIIESVIESEKLLIQDSLIGSTVEPWLNRWRHKYIIYKLLKFEIIIKIKIIIYILFNVVK